VSDTDRELQERLERLERIAESPAAGLSLEAQEPEVPAEPAPSTPPTETTTVVEEESVPTLIEVLTPWRELLFRDLTSLSAASNHGPKKFIEILRKALRDHQLDSLLTESTVKQIASQLAQSDSNGHPETLSPSVLAALFEASFKDKFATSGPINWKPAAGERRLRTLLLVGAEKSGKTTAAVGLAREALAMNARVVLADCTPDHRTSGISLTSWRATYGLDVVAPIVNSKPHHVAYKAIHRAQDEKADVLLLDTPSGFTPKGKVSEAVTNIAAMIAREQPYPPHDTILVLDASSPEQALTQGKRFLAEGSFSGLLLTHVDKIPSPGALIAISEGLKIPVWHLNYGNSGREITGFNPVTLSRAFWAASTHEASPDHEESSVTEELRP
jgi:fused signal recognition particle receptor